MNIIYAGTPDFAVPALQALIASEHEVVAVYTQPDRPAGRGRQLQASPVKACAVENGLQVLQPVSFKEQVDVEVLKSFNADLMVVAAYGLLLPLSVLQAPLLGCINIHASILPRWRGAAPIQRAILAGDQHTGVTLMQMDVGLDTGDMLATSSIDIGPNITAAQLHDKLKAIGAGLLIQYLPEIEQGSINAVKQDDARACYASKLTKQEAQVDWSRSAQQLHREIRAFNPWPVSYSTLRSKSIKIWSADLLTDSCNLLPGQIIVHNRDGIQVCCGSGVLNITELQFAGKKRSHAGQLLNSTDLSEDVFGA